AASAADGAPWRRRAHPARAIRGEACNLRRHEAAPEGRGAVVAARQRAAGDVSGRRGGGDLKGPPRHVRTPRLRYFEASATLPAADTVLGAVSRSLAGTAVNVFLARNGRLHDIAKVSLIRATHRPPFDVQADATHDPAGDPAAVRPLQLWRGNPARSPHFGLLRSARHRARRSSAR